MKHVQRNETVKAEYTYGDSRIDFYMEHGDDKFLMEVKGCILEVDGMSNKSYSTPGLFGQINH